MRFVICSIPLFNLQVVRSKGHNVNYWGTSNCILTLNRVGFEFLNARPNEIDQWRLIVCQRCCLRSHWSLITYNFYENLSLFLYQSMICRYTSIYWKSSAKIKSTKLKNKMNWIWIRVYCFSEFFIYAKIIIPQQVKTKFNSTSEYNINTVDLFSV